MHTYYTHQRTTYTYYTHTVEHMHTYTHIHITHTHTCNTHTQHTCTHTNTHKKKCTLTHTHTHTHCKASVFSFWAMKPLSECVYIYMRRSVHDPCFTSLQFTSYHWTPSYAKQQCKVTWRLWKTSWTVMFLLTHQMPQGSVDFVRCIEDKIK